MRRAADRMPQGPENFLADESDRRERRARAGADLFGEALEAAGVIDAAEADPLAGIEADRAASREGERIGPYRLTALIGRGGMGAVYAAERIDGSFEQRVALKLLRGDRAAPQSLERFRRERAILARLQHPNIAGLLDGGVTPDGETWFAMERIDGNPLIEYADRHALSLQARLALFRQVADAVAFAHRSLVVHRDLKPSNILIDGDGRAKLLDFGIAKLIEADVDATDQPLTLAEERVLTPDYAAPEQILGQPITTATDVYALGLLLYELLTGRQAQSLRGLAWIDMSARVCSDESPMPSRAPSDATAGVKVAVRPELLRGDLDAIVLKALRKEPEQRYASVLALLEDIGRYCDGRPVVARAGSRRYRWSRFVQRNRIAVAATLAVLLALTLGLGMALWQTRVARMHALRSDEVRSFLVQMFHGIDQSANAGHEVTARELLDASAGRLSSELSGQPEVQAELLETLGALYLRLGRSGPATEMLARSLTIQRGLPQRDPVQFARTLLSQADAVGWSGKFDEARTLLDEADATLAGNGAATQELRARVLDMRITFDAQDDDAIKGERDSRALVAFEATRKGKQSAEYGTALIRLGGALTTLDRFAEAESTIREGMALRSAAVNGQPLRRPDYTKLLTVLQLRGRYAEALAEADSLYEASRARNGDAYIETVNGRLARGLLLAQVGRSAEAETELREGLAALESNHLGAPVLMPNAYGLLGRMLTDQGRLDEGTPLVRAVAEHVRKTRGPASRGTQYAERDLGAVLIAAGNLDEADALLQHAAELARAHSGEDCLQLAEVRARQSALELARGNTPEAERLARLALPVLDRGLGPDHDETARAHHALGRALLARGEPSKAEAELELAVRRYEAVFTANDVRTREYRYDWAEALAALDDPRANDMLRASAQELVDDPRYAGATHSRAEAWLAGHRVAGAVDAAAR